MLQNEADWVEKFLPAFLCNFVQFGNVKPWHLSVLSLINYLKHFFSGTNHEFSSAKKQESRRGFLLFIKSTFVDLTYSCSLRDFTFHEMGLWFASVISILPSF